MTTQMSKDEMWKQIEELGKRLHTGTRRERWDIERKMQELLAKVKE